MTFAAIMGERYSTRAHVDVLLLIFFLMFAVMSTPVRAAPPSATGPSFRLIDQTGRAVDERILGKKASVLHFGFTHCPVICPTTMFEVAERMRELGSLADNIQFIFVTVDPERDTPEHLGPYLASFDDRIIGLTGSPSEIKALADGLGAAVTRQALENGAFTFDHTIFAFLMAPGWSKAGTIYMGSDARSDRVLAILRSLVAQADHARTVATKQ